jgi:hypothetical protein
VLLLAPDGGTEILFSDVSAILDLSCVLNT